MALRSGSSPRVRGTQKRNYQKKWGNRFIPACAGNACVGLRREVFETVHPRVCGERAHIPHFIDFSSGSSPRVRGTLERLRLYQVCPRFIPACAGNAYLTYRVLRQSSVHPRVCGERCPGLKDSPWFSGSSPRVRGTQTSASQLRDSNRFIPACAGNAAR